MVAPEAVGPLWAFIAAAPALELRGTWRPWIGDVLGAVSQNLVVSSLDVSGNGIGNELVPLLRALLEAHSGMTRVIFDMNGIEYVAKEEVLELFRLLPRLDRQVVLSFPSSDMEKQTLIGMVTEQELYMFQNESLSYIQWQQGEEKKSEVAENVTVKVEELDFLEIIRESQPEFGEMLLTDEIQAAIGEVNKKWLSDKRWEKENAEEPVVDPDDRLLAMGRRLEVAQLIKEICAEE
jgi:hypothetical protein